MTDKQIIIDGIDVGGCIYYEDGKCLNGEMVQCNCKKVAVCYYKEYKRKEQECDMWKNLTVDNGAVALKYQQQLDQLKEQLEAYKMEAEEGKEINAELKAELTRANCQIADDEILQCDMREAIEELKAENDKLKVRNVEYMNGNIGYQLKNSLYKQTLTEIKEIAEKMKNMQEECGKCMSYTTIQCKQILQKISEVEDADKT